MKLFSIKKRAQKITGEALLTQIVMEENIKDAFEY